MLDDLTGRVALVGNRGIGCAIAIALSEAGADVAVNSGRSRRKQTRSAGRSNGAGRGGGASRYRRMSALRRRDASRRQRGSVARGGRDPGQQRGRQQAGGARSAQRRAVGQHDRYQSHSAFLVTQAVLPRMRESRWGRIINVSSVAAQLGGVVGLHYAASSGHARDDECVAALLAKEGITANAIAPALIETAMITNNSQSEARSHSGRPVRRGR